MVGKSGTAGMNRLAKGKAFRIMEYFEVTPFDDMEEIEDGLYREVIFGSGGEGTCLDENDDAEALVFGRIEDTLLPCTCMDDECSLLACVEMILANNGVISMEAETDSERILTLYDAERMFANHGFQVEWQEGEEIDSLLEALDGGGTALCLINDLALHVPELSDCPWLDATYPVIVTEIDFTNPTDVRVLMDDPRSDTGRRSCNLSGFLSAWEKGNNKWMLICRER